MAEGCVCRSTRKPLVPQRRIDRFSFKQLTPCCFEDCHAQGLDIGTSPPVH
jgi:hypothetical protein